MSTTLERYAREAAARHRDAAGLVQAVADDLPVNLGRPWRAVASALASGDEAAVVTAARRDARCWLPLMASGHDDPQLLPRLVAAAGQPVRRASPGWSALAYPLVVGGFALLVLYLLSVIVIPIFSSLFDDFGMQLPWPTRVAVGLARFMASGWGPLFLALGLIALGRWLSITRSPRGARAAEAFSRSTAMLRGANVPGDDAVQLAAAAVGVQPPMVAAPRPRGPLTPAAAEALRHDPAAAAVLLSALAECHGDRARGGLSTTQWLIGPVAIGLVGLVVGFVVIALFMPLVTLVSALS